MLLRDPVLLLKIILGIWLLFSACAGYAYLVNARRTEDDPEKKKYHPLAVVTAPVSVPIFLTLGIFVFFIRAILFITFLVIFTILTVLLRKPFLLVWLDKIARKIGDALLKINTELIKLALSPWTRRARPA